MKCANCKWTEANHTNSVAAALTCGDYTAVQVRNAGPSAVFAPERCAACNEPFTPSVTKGSYKCKCDQPKPPRSVLEAANATPLTGQVRYGGR